MAKLIQDEFQELIRALVDRHGLGGLRSKLHRANALVSGRAGKVDALARQLYQLTIGLDRNCIPSQAILALWEDLVASSLDEATAEKLESVAEEINGCLVDEIGIDPAKESDLDRALEAYHGHLSGRLGEVQARLTMLIRAVPAVAERLRRSPPSPRTDESGKSSPSGPTAY